MIVVICDRPESRWPVDLVPPDVPIFYGKQADPLACFNAALRESPARAVVRVSADSPFVDPVLIDRLVNTAEDHPNGDYIGYRFGDGRPVIQSRLGVVAEWCQTAALVQADRETADPLDRQQVTRYLYCHPEKFSLRLLPVPQNWIAMACGSPLGSMKITSMLRKSTTPWGRKAWTGRESRGYCINSLHCGGAWRF